MEWIQRLNSAIGYIEEHLTDEIDYEQLGRIACCSAYHFQRMFSYMAGVPLSEYIRRRKMSRAAADLQSGRKIVDVACDYGYQSPTAFSRAFQSVHGIPPSTLRQEGVSVRSYPPLTFTITIKGVEAMQYRIETREAFRVVGVSMPLSKEVAQNFQEVPKLWQESAMNGTLQKLAGMMDSTPMGMLGVSACNDAEQWRYFIAVATTQPADGLEEYTVPAATWAVFSGSGPSISIQKLEERIITEWLPTSGYEYANGPDMEVYLNPDPQNARYEVWIPVTKQ